MGGTKIIVLKLKEIIKTALIVIAGIILILLLIKFFLPKDKDNAGESVRYMPGTYTAEIYLSKGSADVEVTVSEDKITKVVLKNIDESQEVFYPLLKPTMEIIASEILETQSLTVDIPSENTVTGQVLVGAIEEALEKAKQN